MRQAGRQLRRQAVCKPAGKVIFRDKLAAEMVLAYAGRPGGASRREEVRTYKCPHGNHWHITSQEQSPKRRVSVPEPSASPVRPGICAGPACGKSFTLDPTRGKAEVAAHPQLYCSRKCRVRAKDARKKPKGPVCGKTGKVIFPDQAAAEAELGRAQENAAQYGNSTRREARAYPCSYGYHWHLTSMPKGQFPT